MSLQRNFFEQEKFSILLRNVRNKAVPSVENSYDCAVLYSSSLSTKHMAKANNRIIRIRNETCSTLSIKKSGRRYFVKFIVNLEHIPHLILVYVINFELVNVCLKPVSQHYIYFKAERDHSSAVVSVNFEHMVPCSSVSTVDYELVFIFLV